MSTLHSMEPAVRAADIRLVSLDFDGTILVYDDPAGVFHQDVVDLLNSLEKQGIRWCANSGRDLPDQLGVIERSVARGLTHLPEALICSESVVYVRTDGGYESLEPWNTQAHENLRMCHAQVQKNLVDQFDYIEKTYQPISSLVGEHYTAFFVHDRDGLPLKLFRDMKRFLDGVNQVMLTRNGGWVSVMHVDLGKGNALSEYARHIDLRRDHILAIGDQYNDLSMLTTSVAGHVGCPANAIPEVRQAVKKAGGMVATVTGPLGTIEVIRALLDGQRQS